MTRETIGIMQAQYGVGYPFVDPSDDVSNLVADLAVCYETLDFVYPSGYKLAGIYGLLGETTVPNRQSMDTDIVLQNLDGQDIFDSRQYQFNLSDATYADSLAFQRSNTDSLNNSENTSYCRFQRSSWGSDFTLLYWETYFISVRLLVVNSQITTNDVTPQSAVLDLRSVYCVPKRVRSINGVRGTQVSLLSGSYLRVSQEEDTENPLRRATNITLDSIPKFGTDVVADCTDTPGTYITSVNGSKPDANGNFNIDVSDGYGLEAVPGGLEIYNSNTPCCSCEAMTAFGEYLNKVGLKYLVAGGKGRWIKTEYQNWLDKWNSLIIPKPPVKCMNIQMRSLGGGVFELLLQIKNTSKSQYLAYYSLSGSFNQPVTALQSITTIGNYIAPVVDGKRATFKDVPFLTSNRTTVFFKWPFLEQYLVDYIEGPQDITAASSFVALTSSEATTYNASVDASNGSNRSGIAVFKRTISNENTTVGYRRLQAWETVDITKLSDYYTHTFGVGRRTNYSPSNYAITNLAPGKTAKYRGTFQLSDTSVTSLLFTVTESLGGLVPLPEQSWASFSSSEGVQLRSLCMQAGSSDVYTLTITEPEITDTLKDNPEKVQLLLNDIKTIRQAKYDCE